MSITGESELLDAVVYVVGPNARVVYLRPVGGAQTLSECVTDVRHGWTSISCV